MQITTLGPLAVDGRPVRGERLAAVVRRLVDARGRVVPTPLLVDAVWDGAPPEDAAGAVQALVSRVRRLGLEVIAVPGGYQVPAEGLEVDAVRARATVERAQDALRDGDAATARRRADEARALFPEVPELGDDLATRLFAEVAGVRASAALAGEGPLDDADLRLLAARTPPDEPSVALLVRVLAAQGRPAEALEVVARLRAELAERYGTDPSPVVTRVHLALLRGELPALDGDLNGDGKPAGATADVQGEAPPVPRPRPAPRRPAVAVLPASWRRSGTPLVGREGDVAAVVAALGEGPLVTVVASGGAGKTRLAAEVARQVASTGGAVRVVELAGLRSPEEVLPAVLAVISVADGSTARADLVHEWRGLSSEDRLASAAADLDGLLVLDNCEHLLDAAADAVADLLAAAPPDVAVLATSRAPLSLPGEVVHRLRTLPDDAALGLLETRARAGGAHLSGDDARALELCHRLDNLPLALELAAARLRHMPIDDVLAGLSDRFGLLDDALRGLPERHASLWAMVDWSRELLGEADRDLLQRLAVVPAPFTADTAARVAGTPQVWRGLATLVEQSLLMLEDGDDGRPRYRMLETVREYGDVRLDAAGGRDGAMAGLVAWGREVGAEVVADGTGPDQITAFGRCAADQDNLVEVLRWAIANDDEAAAVDVAAALFLLWTVRDLHQEVVTWARLLLLADDPVARRTSVVLGGSAVAGDRPLPDADRLAWVGLLVGINSGVMGQPRLFVLGRRVLATLLAQRAAEIPPRVAALVTLLPVLVSMDLELGLARANDLIEHPDPLVQAFGLFLRAAVQENRGVFGGTMDDAVEAYHRFEAAGNHWGMGMAAQGIGQWSGVGRREGAEEWLRRGVRHFELVGATQDVGSIRLQLDIHLALDGDQDAALRVREAVTLPGLRDDDLSQARLGLAQLALREGRSEEALEHVGFAASLVDSAVFLPPQARVLLRAAIAVLYLNLADEVPGELEARAVAQLDLARPDALTSRDIPVLGCWVLGCSALSARRGDLGRARELWVLGGRLGANAATLFAPGYAERLTATLGEEGSGEPLGVPGQEQGQEQPIAVGLARIRELVDGLLGG